LWRRLPPRKKLRKFRLPAPRRHPPPEASATVDPAGPVCELHVWPTDNYIGINTGLLSGFGLVGAVADVAAHDGRVKTVKELMADYLGPEVQVAELNRVGLLETLKLPANYKIIIEEPTPFNEDLKNNPELKAKVKQMNETIKAGRRLSSSTSLCYAELATTHIFYHKAMMYGSNLFVGWIYRDFGDKPIAQKVGKGQVKNPLEEFPPKSADMIPAAQAELRDAYAKDFKEYVEKKVKP
jgi:hypothetical protein